MFCTETICIVFLYDYRWEELGVPVGHSPFKEWENLVQLSPCQLDSHNKLIGGLACQGPVNDCHILVTIRTNSQPQ